ncbi:MAG TPA: PspC domain-containing protein [Micromonosporaceae bacterium]|nr:PspC domain-containing protein [Micromonosporaceae bacterium]
MQPPAAVPVRRLRRDRDNKILAGVASGIAEHLGVPSVAVRVAFIVLFLANGLGALLYVAFWAVLPVTPAAAGTGAGAPRAAGRRTGWLQILGLFALGVGVILTLIQAGGFGIDGTLVALAVVVALGAGIIWHQAEPQRRRASTASEVGASPRVAAGDAAVEEAAEPVERRWVLLRLGGGGLLVIVGVIGILSIFAPAQADLSAMLVGLFFAMLALAGLVVAFAPLLWRMIGQLREERVARIREQERAEVAAIVHDQVLHTLALIQRNANDPTSVLRLARGQERTLRNWLYKPVGSPSERFAAALEQVAAEVEDTYAITVETVVVGDAEHDERVGALVAATREALVNAARHAKVGTVSLYAEAEEEQFSIYVRDRGVGFDLSNVDGDRHGVRGSIIGRMQRHGGEARIKSVPGDGTEVALTMPRRRTTAAGSAGRE